MAKHFIRLYREILDDPRMGRLPADLWRFAVELMLVVNDECEIPDSEEIAFILRRSKPEVESLIKRLWVDSGGNFIALWKNGIRGYDYYYSLRASHESVSRVLDKNLRKWVLDRNCNICVYCGDSADHVDHVIPVCQGGSDETNNLVAACAPCNMKKGGRTPDQAGMEMHYG